MEIEYIWIVEQHDDNDDCSVVICSNKRAAMRYVESEWEEEARNYLDLCVSMPQWYSLDQMPRMIDWSRDPNWTKFYVPADYTTRSYQIYRDNLIG